MVIAAFLGSYWSTRHLVAQSASVTHTHQVRAAVAALLTDLRDADDAQRGFAFTGDETYLQPYAAAQNSIAEGMRALQKLTADNPAQQRDLEALRPQIDQKLSDLRMLEEQSRHGARDAVLAGLKAGRREMAAIRARLSDMEAEEVRLLVERTHAASVAGRTAVWILALETLLASTLIILFYAAVRRHLRLRESFLTQERTARAEIKERFAEQRRMQGALNATEVEARRLAQMNEAVVQNMGEGLYTVDRKGLLTSMNPTAERLLGWTEQELQGRNMHDSIHYKHPDGTAFPAEECAGLQVLTVKETLTNHEDAFVRKDGTCFPVAYSAARLVTEGDVGGLVVVFQDVTHRKTLEAERERLLATAEAARAEAERASRAKDSFLATISHELRTPLSPILAWATLLERNLDPENVRKGLETIQRCARAQAQLIEDLLDVSRIVAGRMRLEVRPVDLAGIIEAAIDVVRPAAEAKGVRLHLLLDTKTLPVSGDAVRLQQVIWNLLSNAIKFTPKGGRATVTLERVNSHAQIAVSDTGQGIDRDFLPHVFDRFLQADTSSTRVHLGLGLGLAIVRHIVEAHGGTVHAESPGPGKGSVFTVKLPLVLIQRAAGETLRRHPTEMSITSADFPQLNGIRVLAVDDDPDSNETLRTLFTLCGAETRTARSVSEALEVIVRWPPEVLVSDVGMPGENGYSLIAKLRAREVGSRGIPAVALTAYASTDDRVRLLSAGFTAHVPKPVEPAELLAVVARALADRRE